MLSAEDTKELIETEKIADEAINTAKDALYNLYTRVDGTSYIKLNLTPNINDHTGIRTLTLELDEAEINELSGEISKDGVITTYSFPKQNSPCLPTPFLPSSSCPFWSCSIPSEVCQFVSSILLHCQLFSS